MGRQTQGSRVTCQSSVWARGSSVLILRSNMTCPLGVNIRLSLASWSDLNVLAWTHTLRPSLCIAWPSEHSSRPGYYEMWSKSLCCGVTMYVVHYVSLWVALLCIMIQSRVWVSEEYRANLNTLVLISGLNGMSLCHDAMLDMVGWVWWGRSDCDGENLFV